MRKLEKEERAEREREREREREGGEGMHLFQHLRRADSHKAEEVHKLSSLLSIGRHTRPKLP